MAKRYSMQAALMAAFKLSREHLGSSALVVGRRPVSCEACGEPKTLNADGLCRECAKHSAESTGASQKFTAAPYWSRKGFRVIASSLERRADEYTAAIVTFENLYSEAR